MSYSVFYGEYENEKNTGQKNLTFSYGDLNPGFLKKLPPTIWILREIRSIELTVLKKPQSILGKLLVLSLLYCCQDFKRCFKVFHSVQDGHMNNYFGKSEKTNDMWLQKDFNHIVDLACFCFVRQQGCVILHPQENGSGTYS